MKFRPAVGRPRRYCLRSQRHAGRRSHECWNDKRGRSWKKEAIVRWRGRRQDNELARPRRQEKEWRRRRRCEARALKDYDGPIDEQQLRRRGRGDAKIDVLEIQWRLHRRGEPPQLAMRIGDMGSVGIAAKIRPIGARCIRHDTVAPDHLLAPNSEHRRDASRKWTFRIGGEELLVAFDRVDLQRGRISILDPRKRAHRFAANVGKRHHVRRRRCVGGALSEKERNSDLRNIPRDFDALSEIADAETNARKNVVEAKAARRNHFRERGGISAVRPLLIGTDCTGRRIERHSHVRHGIDKCQSACERLATSGEGILSRCINNDDRVARKRSQCLGEIGNPDGLQWNVGVSCQIGIDRDVIVFASVLHAVTGEINEGNCIRPGGRNLAKELAERFAQRRLIEVPRAGDGETCGLKRVGDQASIVGRSSQACRFCTRRCRSPEQSAFPPHARRADRAAKQR